jgi:arylsulfatase A-like enzyme
MDDPDREYRHPGYEPDSQTDLAIEFIRQSATEERPFCLAVSFGPPHSPYKAPEKNERRFQPESDIPLAPNVAESAIVEELLRTDTRPISERNAASRKRRRKQLADDSRIQAEILRGYYGACEALDQNIARLLATLDELNLADDTIVVYTSDHGDMVGSHRMVSKQLPFEESIRTPFVLRYPRRVEAGEASSTFITPVDVLPTLLSLAGIAYDETAFDGRFDADREGVLIMKMVHGGNPWINNGVRPWRGTRTNRYTYVELEGAPWLLFDNQEDPHQLDNLIGDNGRSGLRSKLQAQMRGLMQEAGDTLSEDEIDAFRARQKAAIPT